MEFKNVQSWSGIDQTACPRVWVKESKVQMDFAKSAGHVLHLADHIKTILYVQCELIHEPVQSTACNMLSLHDPMLAFWVDKPPA